MQRIDLKEAASCMIRAILLAPHDGVILRLAKDLEASAKTLVEQGEMANSLPEDQRRMWQMQQQEWAKVIYCPTRCYT